MNLKKRASKSIALAIVSVSVASPFLHTASAMEKITNNIQNQSINQNQSADQENQIEMSNEINQILNEISIDLNSNESQSFEKQLSNGEVFKLEVSPENPVSKVSDGVWNIKWNIGICNCSFKIKVSKNKILSAYDGKYIFTGFSVKSARLKVDNSKQATYYFEFGTPIWDFGGWNGWLRANINSKNELKVSIK